MSERQILPYPGAGGVRDAARNANGISRPNRRLACVGNVPATPAITARCTCPSIRRSMTSIARCPTAPTFESKGWITTMAFTASRTAGITHRATSGAPGFSPGRWFRRALAALVLLGCGPGQGTCLLDTESRLTTRTNQCEYSCPTGPYVTTVQGNCPRNIEDPFLDDTEDM